MDKELVISSFNLTKNGLTPLGTPSFDQWRACGEFLRNANGAVHFWIGDWLNYGEQKYGETYAQAIDGTQYDYQTLSNDKWIASRVEVSRRRENLSFSHHSEVAELDPEEQDELLDLADNQKLNRSEFRKVVRSYKLQLDLPELTDEERSPIDQEEFEVVEKLAIKLLDATENIVNLNWSTLHPQAREFLLSQVRKSTGLLGGVITAHDKP